MSAKDVNILVVDDEPSVRESFEMILKIRDYQVTTAGSVVEAQQKVDAQKFDVAFVDLKLDKNDEGIDVLKYIKGKTPQSEVIIVTAYATDRTQAHAIELGAMEYISKPFLMEDIYDLVNRALRKREQN